MMSLGIPGAGWARLGTADELPEWYKPYAFVYSGYRLGYGPCACAASVLSWHNETLNIWTHLLGGVAWFGACEKLWRVLPASRRPVHAVLWTVCGAMPLASATAHTFHCVGRRASKALWRLDMASVAALLYSRAVVEGTLFLACWPPLVASWIVAATAVCGVAALLAVALDRPNWLALSFSFLHLPLIYHVLRDNDADASRAVRLVSLGSLSGVVGFLVRATNVPERWIAWRPSKPTDCRLFFDLVGASHQIWHLATILGPVLCLYGTVDLLAYRLHQPCRGHAASLFLLA